MAKRLIDANALLEDFGEEPLVWSDGEAEIQERNDWRKYRGMVESAPTVDAVEVVHGQWHIDVYDSGDPCYYTAYIEVHCSKCGYELDAESGQYGWCDGDPFPLNYCPNCGAKMDKEN